MEPAKATLKNELTGVLRRVIIVLILKLREFIYSKIT